MHNKELKIDYLEPGNYWASGLPTNMRVTFKTACFAWEITRRVHFTKVIENTQRFTERVDNKFDIPIYAEDKEITKYLG